MFDGGSPYSNSTTQLDGGFPVWFDRTQFDGYTDGDGKDVEHAGDNSVGHWVCSNYQSESATCSRLEGNNGNHRTCALPARSLFDTDLTCPIDSTPNATTDL